MKNLEENKLYFYITKNTINKNFKGFSEFGNVYYPLKSNSNIKILKILKPLLNKNDNGFLISYITHYKLLRKIGVSPKKMCYINVLAEDETIEYLYKHGIRFFHFDNMNSLGKYLEYADLKKSKIAIRLSPTSVFESNLTHLGANTKECKNMLEYLKNKECNYGISFYLNEKVKDDLDEMLEYIIQNFKGEELSFISIGGVKSYKEINYKKVEQVKQQLNIKQIILEPGNHLLENSVDVKSRIIRKKKINNTTLVIIKNGIYSGFLDCLLYNKQFEIYLGTKNNDKVKLGYSKKNTDDYEFWLYGGSSDSADKLGKFYIDNKYKNDIKENANIYVKNVGTYFEEFFMNYSHDLKRVYKIRKECNNYEI